MANGHKVGDVWNEGTGQSETTFTQLANGVVQVTGKTYPKQDVEEKQADGTTITVVKKPNDGKGLDYTTFAPTFASLTPAARKTLAEHDFTEDMCTTRQVFGYKNTEQSKVGREWRKQYKSTGVTAAKDKLNAHMSELVDGDDLKAAQDFNKQWKACGTDSKKLIALADKC